MSASTFSIYKRIISKSFLIGLLFFVVLYNISIVHAAYERYATGDTAVIGEFVYEDDFTPSSADCTVFIYNSSGSLIVNGTTMTEDANGWHHYSYSIPSSGPEGIWPSYMSCGTVMGGDLVKMDKSFVVGATVVSTTTLANSVWTSTTRTLTSFGTLVSDVWSNSVRTLTGASLDTGSLATQSDVVTASSSLAAAISAGTVSVNSNTNATILSASTSLASFINANTNSQISSAITTINNNTNATVLTASTSLASTIPTAVWSASARSLTTFGTLAADVWTNGTRTLTSGSTLTASDVWTYATRRLSDGTLDTGSLATAANLTSTETAINNNTNSASSSLNASIVSNTSGITSAVNANVNSASSSLAAAISAGTVSVNSNTNATVLSASTSLASFINANTNSQISSAITTINNNTNATVLTASTSLASTIPTAVWSASARSLTTFGTLAADVWNASTRTLTSLTLSSQSPWTVNTSDFGTITAGSTYLATVNTIYNGTIVDSANVPTITIYDPSRNVVVNNVAMTRTSVGTYTYSYTTPVNAEAGTWESVFSTTVESGKTLPGNDYWTVVTNPAQVIINSISDNITPEVAANITITNEGLGGNEYQYEWCVVSGVNNPCGGGDDVFHAIAAKYINPGEDFNTTLTATVPNAGNYYFKVVVYFGTDSSGASRTFTAVAPTSPPSGGGGGGGGGSGGGGSVPPATGICRRADFNCDTKINSIDFSILLYFWKSRPPFTNIYVDINKDGKIDSVDFSILLYEWGKK